MDKLASAFAKENRDKNLRVIKRCGISLSLYGNSAAMVEPAVSNV